MRIIKGYDTVLDTNTGEMLSVQRSTGEVLPAIAVNVPVGSIIYTPEQQEEYKRRKEQEDERRQWRKETGQFFFVLEEYGDAALRPATKARLVYLATYLRYDGYLALSQRIPMKFGNLKDILNLSTTEVYRFWNEVKGAYITEDNQGRMRMLGGYFQRGQLNGYAPYQKFFIDAVRTLYRNTAPKKHKHLGYVFQMLPFVNTEYNILCYNPTEKDLNYVLPLSVNDFCATIGYNVANRARLLQTYAEITFLVNGHLEQLCSFVTNGADIGISKIFINPHILYFGKCPKQVELLGKFCRIDA